ncbi:MAG: alpha/beta hydrolase [Anaerolineaceae bacterium]|jgi:pimeloyl-ACP methyl ester carboxylesterase|nr:alpha/beta hydrolase [Anaerolineaceae bacterium]
MEMPATKNGIQSKMVKTDRLEMHVLFSGKQNDEPVIFLHGNFSAALFWQDLMLSLPEGFRGIAPDLRGYGWTEDKLTDATLGLKDWSEDILALMDSVGVDKAHFVAWSLGAAPIYRLLISHPHKVKSMTFVAPVSPYGFGGSKDAEGTPVYEDFAGCGGGLVNAEFVRRIQEGDRSADDPNSPRNIINTFYYVAPFKSPDEEDLLTAALQEKIGNDKYPGDSVPSTNWPFVGPGKWGPINGGSGKYMLQVAADMIAVQPKAPILWIRGDQDQVVSDLSIFDIPTLGKLGFVPGYPGEDVCPPQPMVTQTRAVFEKYQMNGGSYKEVVILNTAHSPHIEKLDEFNQSFHKFLKESK